MNDKKIWIIISAVSGFTTVALGAFGAHGLKSTISAEMLEIFKTGIFYQFVHTIVLLILSVTNFIKGKISSILFLLGIILFSFSLYLYSTSGIKIFAIITPVGGVCFLIGWLGIIIEVVRKKQ
ncbi:MAG: DUF423 domain-containing protein [Ignavibacteriota bacterium]|nr:MAG: DUF423 domain-containing protein [Chlorobiota bacterium]MBE7476129.1 DUF423 domain-containing protein [Ignavibacteriales bacterium]MBL1124120.1 DUF423 domain-containing protein [Ignavibacteriota bacterium]MCC7094835.1 DUF423 domain-containing protein [Ignavibacteriaceae bacterium]MCE7857280.1 DUF423 domain-containing protein [Ignavibacteria bacterium CHB3]MEB2296683.1 DUF423 domain-containing protein [Ignavibacteria bacterium]